MRGALAGQLALPVNSPEQVRLSSPAKGCFLMSMHHSANNMNYTPLNSNVNYFGTIRASLMPSAYSMANALPGCFKSRAKDFSAVLVSLSGNIERSSV